MAGMVLGIVTYGLARKNERKGLWLAENLAGNLSTLGII
jgi:hypothetical protein